MLSVGALRKIYDPSEVTTGAGAQVEEYGHG
jgi:hypothetical protein